MHALFWSSITRSKYEYMENLSQENRQQYNSQDHGQDEQQKTCSTPRILLVPTRRSKLDIRTSSIISDRLHIVRDQIQLLSLLVHDMGDIPEKLIELTDTLLDISDLRFPFDDQRILEIDVILRCQSKLLLFLLLLKSSSTLPFMRRRSR